MHKATKRPTAAFFAVLAAAFGLYFLMMRLQGSLAGNAAIFSYGDWYAKMRGEPLYRFFWMIGDMTEPPFFKSLPGGVSFLVSCLVVYILDRRRSRYRGTPLCYGNGANWPWIFLAGFLGVVFSGLLYGGLEIENDPGWICTFVPFVCVPSAVIFLYGGGWKNVLTGAALAAVFTTPICIFLRSEVLIPWKLPGLIGVVASMALGGMICFQICALLPWMKMPGASAGAAPPPAEGELPDGEYMRRYPGRFFVRRLFASFSEPMFIGNEIVGGAIVLGTLVSWVMNPDHVVYGSGLLPALLLSEFLTAAIALYLFWHKWLEYGYYPTFTPIVATAPTLTLVYGNKLPVILVVSILGAVINPPLAEKIIACQPPNWHPVIGNTAAMAISVTVVALFMRYLLMAFPVLA